MKSVVGIDEVGRGPVAGPVTVCALYIKDKNKAKKMYFGETIRDSKKLKKDSRTKVYETIRINNKFKNEIVYAVASKSAEYIDKNGINKSIKTCIKSCLKSLEKKGIDFTKVDFELDGGLFLDKTIVKQKTYIKGDENHTSIALASIVAKVSRDSYMERLSVKFPEYKWCTNAGYGTKKHYEAINRFGVTKFHRKTYLKEIKLFENTESI